MTTIWHLCIRFTPDGGECRSQHISPRYVVRYLMRLHDLGEDVQVLSVREGGLAEPVTGYSRLFH